MTPHTEAFKDIAIVLFVNLTAIGVSIVAVDIALKAIPAIIATAYTLWKWKREFNGKKRKK